ncbi:MAG: hypothetical protein ABSD56_01095 [Bryobacteraceae bacterium]
MAIGVPSPKPQPNKPSYGLNELELFTRYTRDSYRTATGSPAPPCDPTKKLKCWLDSTVDLDDPGDLVAYNTAKRTSDGKTALKKFSMPAQEAATANLPGRESYAAYVVQPTQAVIRNASMPDSPVGPATLCTLAEAQMLAGELGGNLIQGGMPGIIYPPEENRRWFDIGVKGNQHNAGLLLLERYQSGVGVPGHWDTSGSEPKFIVELPPDNSTLGEWPVPLRDLLSNEKIEQLMAFGGPGVVRTDLQHQEQEKSGLFLQDDRALLQQIDAKLDAVAASLAAMRGAR